MNVKPGDICVFKNGEEATVTKYEGNRDDAVSIIFDRDVIGYSDQAANRWVYDSNGRFLRPWNDPDGNDIVKIVRS